MLSRLHAKLRAVELQQQLFTPVAIDYAEAAAAAASAAAVVAAGAAACLLRQQMPAYNNRGGFY